MNDYGRGIFKNHEDVLLMQKFGRGLVRYDGLRRMKALEAVKSRDAFQPNLLNELNYASGHSSWKTPRP
jgi:hypothetical protein